uniref:Uncharacterized protein n=1 Tax=Mustela putorius furo TaxID=9669 RepID=M3XRM6_MUSPF
AAGGGAPSGSSGGSRKSGKEPPGSGDLTSLTTQPNGIGTHVSRHPHSRQNPPAQLISGQILREETCSAAAYRSPEDAGRGELARQTRPLTGQVVSGFPDDSGPLAKRIKRPRMN